MSEATLRWATGNNAAKIQMSIAPLPLTYKQTNGDQGFSGMVILFYLGIGMSFIPALITTFLVKEIETNMKH